MVILESYTTRLEAEVARGFLATHTINAVVQADDAGGMRGFPLQYTFGVNLLVEEKNVKKAKKLLLKKK